MTSWRQFPLYWMIAAWLWLDIPTAVWWAHHESWQLIWRSPLGFVSNNLRVDHLVAGGWYLMGVGILVMAYAQMLLDPPVKRRWDGILIGATLALATISIPFVSHDVFAYFGEWRTITLYHQDPMTTPIAAIPHWRQHLWLDRAGWQKTVNPYGPLWFLIVRFVGLVGARFIAFYAAWKLLALTFVLLGGLIVDLLKKGQGRLFLLHPVMSIECLCNAHNDIVMVTLLMAAYVFWLRRQYVLAGMLAGLSIATKYLSVIALGSMIWLARGLKPRLWAMLSALAVVLLSFIPWWRGMSTLWGPLASSHLFLRSPAFIIQGTLVHMTGMARGQSRHIAKIVTTLAFLLGYGWSTRKYSQNRDPLYLGDGLLAAALILMSWLQFWYLTWALPFYLIGNGQRSARMVMYLAYLEVIRVIGWPLGLPAGIQIVQTASIWLGLWIIVRRPHLSRRWWPTSLR